MSKLRSMAAIGLGMASALTLVAGQANAAESGTAPAVDSKASVTADKTWTSTTDAAGQTFSSTQEVRFDAVTGTQSTNAEAGVLGGQFNWTADFNARLVSRNYSTPNYGSHRIHLGYGTNCKNVAGTGPETFTVTLYADRVFDANLGKRTISCAYGGNADFHGITGEAFYFTLTSSYWGATPNRTLAGSTFYP